MFAKSILIALISALAAVQAAPAEKRQAANQLIDFKLIDGRTLEQPAYPGRIVSDEFRFITSASGALPADSRFIIHGAAGDFPVSTFLNRHGRCDMRVTSADTASVTWKVREAE